KVWKSLLGCQRHLCLCPLLDCLSLAAVLMEQGSKMQGKCQGKGVGQLLSASERLLAPRQGLVRIAEQPQRQGRKRPAMHNVIYPRPGVAGLLKISERQHLCKLRVGKRQLSQPEPGFPEHLVGLEKETRVLEALSQTKALLCQLVSHVVLRPNVIKYP